MVFLDVFGKSKQMPNLCFCGIQVDMPGTSNESKI